MSEIHRPQQNSLLASLPARTQERIYPYLMLTSLSVGKDLYESGQNLRHVYFPIDLIVSLLFVTESGTATEISLVGNEGFVGAEVLMGGKSAPSRALVQCAGHAYRLSAIRLKEEFDNDSDLRALLLRNIQASIAQMAQTVACNRHHPIEQQLCRWLLLSLDRLQGNQLIMTQELIASMMGVRRESISDAAGHLQKLGVIEYKRGQITLVDRAGLEKLSCECYGVVRQETDRLEVYQTSPL